MPTHFRPTPRRKDTIADCDRCQYRSLRAFCNLTDRALEDFNGLGTQLTRPKGTILFHEADTAENALVVCTGQVKLSCSSKDGRTLILKIAMPGDVLGLGALVSGSRLEVTARTILPTQIKQIGREVFLAFLERHGQASMHAAKALSEEYKSAFFDARRLALSSSAAGRLASVLLEWGSAAACGTTPEMRFTMALTHEDLASVAGMSRETVTRTLGKFQKDKLIDIRGSAFHILKPDKLGDLAA